ncbi:MAG: hypothetical protein ABMA26_14125 [Limisphaerales bacterium]
MNPPEPPAPEISTPKPKHISSLGCWLIGVLVLVLLFISLPGILKSRGFGKSHNSCVANLKHIDGAVQKWALDHKQAATDSYSLRDPQLLRYFGSHGLPVCPGGGRYSPGTNVSDGPKCSLAAWGHTL